MARQFLHLHGLKSPSTTNPVCVQYAFPIEWSTENSNTHLTFSRGNTSVERIGSVSCYPAAFADLPSDRCCFTVMLEACPRGTNWLSFGICRKGRLQISSSDGVGMYRRSSLPPSSLAPSSLAPSLPHIFPPCLPHSLPPSHIHSFSFFPPVPFLIYLPPSLTHIFPLSRSFPLIHSLSISYQSCILFSVLLFPRSHRRVMGNLR